MHVLSFYSPIALLGLRLSVLLGRSLLGSGLLGRSFLGLLLSSRESDALDFLQLLGECLDLLILVLDGGEQGIEFLVVNVYR